MISVIAMLALFWVIFAWLDVIAFMAAGKPRKWWAFIPGGGFGVLMLYGRRP